MWEKYGTADKGRYGIWRRMSEGRPLYRIQRAPIVPQGEAGYRDLTAYLGLKGVTQDEMA